MWIITSNYMASSVQLHHIILFSFIMIKAIWKDTLSKVAIVLFVILTSWWAFLFFSGSTETLGFKNLLFGALYGTSMSLFGVWVGLRSAREWGGWRSIMGRAMLVLSLGLLGQFIGQVAFSYYNIFLSVGTPYPSIADIGYFGNIPLYTFGIILLARASGAHERLKSASSIVQVILLPLVLIACSYYLFLNHYNFAESTILTTILDFGYPLGLGLNVSLIILTYNFSRKMLGGIMRGHILLLVTAFVAQYLADFNFLYQNLTGTWYNGGYGDYLYLVAYFFMTLGLIQLRAVMRELRKGASN